jgi:hypothetical protein
VTPTRSTQELKHYLPDPNCELGFGGLSLLGQISAPFSSNRDGTTLFAVTTGTDYTPVWVHIMSEMDLCNERVRADLRLASENAKLKDLRLSRASERRGRRWKVGDLIGEVECLGVSTETQPSD